MDTRAIDPLTKTKNITKFQSRSLCFPFKIVLGKDNKQLYDEEFKDFFAYYERCREVGVPSLGYKPFITSSPQDMCSHWKSLKRGMGVKSGDSCFCHCCRCKSRNIATPRTNTCERCKRRGKTFCLHHPVGDADTINVMLKELQAICNESVGDIDHILQSSVIHLSPSNADRATDPTSIDFDHQLDMIKLERFSALVNEELKLRNMHTGGLLRAPLQLRRFTLRERLSLENKVIYLREQSQLTPEAAFILIDEAIPCVLHMRNRIGEKLMKEVVKEAIAGCKSTGEVKELKEGIDELLNTKVWGTSDRKGQYSLPLVDAKGEGNKGKALGEITLPNYRITELVNKFDLLIDFCISDIGKRTKLKMCMRYYRKFMSVLVQKEDYTEEQLEMFQDNVDDFMEIWCTIADGKKQMTNYLHLLGAGHVLYYMKKWKNLYRYEQEGWESLNALIKYVYFHHTKRGGYDSKDANDNIQVSSRVGALGKWIVRSLLWRSGVAIKELYEVNECDDNSLN